MTKKIIKDIDTLYDAFSNEIKGKQGIVKISIGEISTISKANDIVGKCIEEWLMAWFNSKTNSDKDKFELIPNNDSQKFPDYEAKFENVLHPIDIKSFKYDKQPAFDIANFDSFLKSTYNNPDKLLADYFIFPYEPNDRGNFSFTIKDVYRKKIWEMIGTNKNHPNRKYPISLQVKKQRPYAIRPGALGPYGEDRHDKDENLENLINKIIDAGNIFDRFGKEGIPTDEKWKKKVSSHIKNNN